MDRGSPRIRSMLRQAERVASNGKRLAAEKLYREILAEAPETAAAWVGLAEVAGDPAERAAAYERALALEPENEAARSGLTRLQDGPVDDEAGWKPAGPGRPGNQQDESTPQQRFDQVVAPLVEPAAPAETVVAPAEGVAATAEPSALPAVEPVEEVLYCINHPNRVTNLRCNRCGRPVCSRCVKLTPVGYRCKTCIREQEEVFFSAGILQYVIAAAATLPMALIGGALAGLVGFLSFFVAAAVGSVIGRVIFRLVGRRRGRWLPHLVAAVVVIGGLLPVTDNLLAVLFGQPEAALSLVWVGIYVAIAPAAAYYQMK
ncbi:MAG: hypothetical protein L0332_25585 [Chloroflexi bacterium]|nr:hypothetical protein [Chloroflexota bacterium]MCI0579427.1 hypothetical protein [Chloroflexota bacterium]MCI0643370.1 hypothetical protein [Chloroflexota bacterium]MCI0730071.1 hypothetical protein [Chloroflexota bacterium]